jgi:sarcosine oxidase subunit beta
VPTRRPTRRYSFTSLLREARRQHSGWEPAWPKAEPKPSYDIVIIGGGGHGLATAYYLAKLHGVKNIAVLEKGWLGGGNTARNTAIIRSNYLRPQSMALYGLSHSLFEHLSSELDFNVLYSPRGLVELAYSRQHMEALSRTADANRHFGIKTWMIPPDEVRALLPLLDDGPHKRYPLFGGLWQPHGAIARHDAVAWGYARMAARLGVDIIENCEVGGIGMIDGRITAVHTSRGSISTGTVLVAAAADSAALVAPLGIELPIEPVTLQAFVSEPLKPVLDVVVLSGAVEGYVSQSDKGELVIGGATDRYPGYSRRGAFNAVEDAVASILELFPALSRVRMMRHWGGTVDITPDRSPIIGKAGPDGLFLNCGWGTGGFKAIPGSGYATASLMTSGKAAHVVEPFGLERFAQGLLIDESAASAVVH